MLQYQALPPHPAVVGERWREMWRERLEARPDWTETWLGHQRRDDLLEARLGLRGLRGDQAAVYAIGGWVDGYTNSVMRLLEGLPGPRKGPHRPVVTRLCRPV